MKYGSNRGASAGFVGVVQLPEGISDEGMRS